MRPSQQFVCFFPRLPWWAWIVLLPLAALAVFLGALFLLVFLFLGFFAGLAWWIRWKWMTWNMRQRPGRPCIRREPHRPKDYDFDLHKVDDAGKDRQ